MAERIECRCGARILLENWSNHLLRQSNGPHGNNPCEELLAELRAKVEALPEILEVAQGYSVVARAAVLALLSPDTGAPES